MIAKTTAKICRLALGSMLRTRMFEARFQTAGIALHRYRGLLAPRHSDYRCPAPRIHTAVGAKFQLDLSDYMDWKVYYDIGLESAHYLFRRIDESSVVVDVGANLGFYSLGCATIAKAGQVIGFEPDEQCFQKLTDNVAMNRFPNLRIHRTALGRESGQRTLVRDDSGNSGLNHIAGPEEISLEAADEPQTVQCMSLDEYARGFDLPPIDVIKIDIEGFESEFLAGARQTILASRPSILIEVCDGHLRRCGSSAAQLVAELKDLGYRTITEIETNASIDSLDLTDCQFDVWCEASGPLNHDRS